ncbi:FkbM family methyltransferase [Magnetospira sp. QH-2]|uniref:FkbM family methyltransferase n=1 Tax=Magnetospira sp. (strain QH-2) TaxID=1288970 RepID=UPI00130D6803|nr:FkbM family methyltransferase [Magnetospira sp. QH-2]
MAARGLYLLIRKALYTYLTKYYFSVSKSKGYKYFKWKGWVLKEAWNDPYKVSSILNNLIQFTNMAKMVDQLTGPSPVIFDIGANVGTYCLACSEINGSRVYAFEPAYSTFKMLEYNILKNKIDNASAHHLGISDFCSEQTIKTSDGNVDSGAFSIQLVENNSDNRETSETARFTTLDQFMAEEAVGKIDFLKARIQGMGHEVAVIEGGRETIKKFRPIIHLIYRQDMYEMNGVSTDPYIELCDKQQYKLYLYNDITSSLCLLDPKGFFAKKSSDNLDLMFIPVEQSTSREGHDRDKR